jgi:hypothetical protein
LTTFTQLTARLKSFLMVRLLVLHLQECLVEFAKVCDKRVFILHTTFVISKDISIFLLLAGGGVDAVADMGGKAAAKMGGMMAKNLGGFGAKAFGSFF